MSKIKSSVHVNKASPVDISSEVGGTVMRFILREDGRDDVNDPVASVVVL